MSERPVCDEALLAQARRLLGTHGRRETLDAALALAVRQRRRERAVAAEAARLAGGHYAAPAEGRP